MANTPFKMKGSPMLRNFGIGSPLHKEETSETSESIKAKLDAADPNSVEYARLLNALKNAYKKTKIPTGEEEGEKEEEVEE